MNYYLNLSAHRVTRHYASRFKEFKAIVFRIVMSCYVIICFEVNLRLLSLLSRNSKDF